MKQRPRMKNMHNGYGNDIQKYIAYGKYSDDSEDEIDIPLRRVRKPEQFIEAQVQEGDTLQAIALRFNCHVSKLMRVNNIHRANEIFAKRTLKIPITEYSVLTESLPLVHTSGNSSPSKTIVVEDNKTIPLATDTELQQKLIVASVNASVLEDPKSLPSTSTSVNNVLFSANFVNNENLIDVNEAHDINDSSPLIVNSPHGDKSVEAVVIKEFTSKGADFGIKWVHLLICILVLGFFVPLIYILYIAEHREQYHHH